MSASTAASSPRSIGARNRRFWSSVPNAAIASPTAGVVTNALLLRRWQPPREPGGTAPARLMLLKGVPLIVPDVVPVVP